MKLLVIVLGLLAIVRAASIQSNEQNAEEKVNYDGYKVYRIQLSTEQQRTILKDLVKQQQGFSIWHERQEHIDFMVPPLQLSRFVSLSLSENFKYSEMIANLQDLINEEQQSTSVFDTEKFGWKRYYDLADIEKFIDKILTTYPTITEEFIIGKSFEGRTIRGIKISHKLGNPGVFIEANIHAREWITSATATWFINELLSSTDPQVIQLTQNYDWYVVPVLNVDGFAYTHRTDRLWRKTRKPVSFHDCIGTDGNRNFDSHWLENGGASENPCAEDYAGPAAFSEPEIKGLADFLQLHKQKFNILLAFHSYSQVLLSPYGHTREELPPNIDDLMDVAKAYADAVGGMSYGSKFTYGTSGGSMYLASGATLDYAYNEVDIKLTYTIEMRDTGRFGFVLPPVQILPNCEETMTGMIALIKEADNLGYMEVKY